MGKCRRTTGARESFHPITRDNIPNKKAKITGTSTD